MHLELLFMSRVSARRRPSDIGADELVFQLAPKRPGEAGGKKPFRLAAISQSSLIRPKERKKLCSPPPPPPLSSPLLENLSFSSE